MEGWVDVLDESRARLRSIALPQLDAVNALVGLEEEEASGSRQLAVDRAERTGADVLDQHGARLGAVAFPQLASMHSIIGREIEDTLDVGEKGRIAAQA